MTLYLRNKNNRTIVDIEINLKREYPNGNRFVELHSVVIIDTYSEFLLENVDKAGEIIAAFQDISELRRWLWESYFGGEENDPTKLNYVIEDVSFFLKNVAEKYDLYFVTD